MIVPDIPSVDILIDKGADFELQVEVAGIDLTGATAEMTGRTAWDSPTSVWTISTGSGITIVGSADLSVITCRIPNATTAALAAPQDGVYNLRYTMPDGTKKHPVKGRFFVHPRATA